MYFITGQADANNGPLRVTSFSENVAVDAGRALSTAPKSDRVTSNAISGTLSSKPLGPFPGLRLGIEPAALRQSSLTIWS